MEAIEIQVTCPDAANAAELGRGLVEKRLAACANVIGPLRSVFHWEGAVEEAEEWLLVLKTRAGLFEAAAEAIRLDHPYDAPAIVAHEMRTDAATARWLAQETGAVR